MPRSRSMRFRRFCVNPSLRGASAKTFARSDCFDIVEPRPYHFHMSWSEIQGHERWVELFREAVRRGRLGHAYLFVGPAGVGKRMFAMELAKALLCERNDLGQLDACGQCESCTLVEARTHPDFFRLGRPWIDPTDQGERERNELPIALMQELCASFGLKSSRGRGKVAVIDDADDFNQESAYCFLQTLEEPPRRSVFILIGTTLEGQLP